MNQYGQENGNMSSMVQREALLSARILNSSSFKYLWNAPDVFDDELFCVESYERMPHFFPNRYVQQSPARITPALAFTFITNR